MDEYRIICVPRTDGIERFYFQINGETRRSSYDKYEIESFAEGYCQRRIPIEREA